MPPGRLTVDDRRFQRDDLFLLREERRLGPVFKTNISGQFVVCVIDHRRSRAILKDNVERLAAVDAPYNRLLPGGFLRCQTGEVHRATRRLFVQALRPDLVENHRAALSEIAARELRKFSSAGEDPPPRVEGFLRTLNRIATAMLLMILFGVRLGDSAFTILLEAYERLGPNAFVWQVGPAQQQAFADLNAAVHSLIANLRVSADGRAPSLLRTIVSEQVDTAIDQNIVGNLVYMVEMGRYDLYSLFHWITKYLSEAPAIVAAIRAQNRNTIPGHLSLAAGTVFETLRLDQSEAVVRKVVQNISFDGWGIPKGGFLRACTREGHRDPAVFPDPEKFDPRRFLDHEFGPAEYSPFGFDHHQCIAGDLVIRLGTTYVEELVHGFDWQVIADGPRERGPYHWVPSSAFAIRLAPRG